jgi:hypothetical protein
MPDVRSSHVAVGGIGVAITGYLIQILSSRYGLTPADATAYTGLIMTVGGAMAMGLTKCFNFFSTKWFGAATTAELDADAQAALDAANAWAESQKLPPSATVMPKA